jgi:hypothetical protein
MLSAGCSSGCIGSQGYQPAAAAAAAAAAASLHRERQYPGSSALTTLQQLPERVLDAPRDKVDDAVDGALQAPGAHAQDVRGQAWGQLLQVVQQACGAGSEGGGAGGLVSMMGAGRNEVASQGPRPCSAPAGAPGRQATRAAGGRLVCAWLCLCETCRLRTRAAPHGLWEAQDVVHLHVLLRHVALGVLVERVYIVYEAAQPALAQLLLFCGLPLLHQLLDVILGPGSGAAAP